MAAVLVQSLTEQVELLAVQKQAGVPEPAFETMADKCKDAVLKAAGGTAAITSGEATALLKLLLGSHFDMTRRSELIQAINGKVSSAMVNQSSKAKAQLQSNLNFHRYVTKKLWDFTADLTNAYNAKLAKWGGLCMSLGATNINEATYVHIVSTWTMAELGPNQTIEAGAAYQRVRDLKTFVKNERKRIRLPHHGVIINFPKNPLDIKTQHPSIWQIAYPDEEPHPCPYDELIIASLRSQLPARRTHQSLQSRRMPAPFLQTYRGQHPDIDLPGFRLLGPAAASHAVHFGPLPPPYAGSVGNGIARGRAALPASPLPPALPPPETRSLLALEDGGVAAESQSAEKEEAAPEEAEVNVAADQAADAPAAKSKSAFSMAEHFVKLIQSSKKSAKKRPAAANAAETSPCKKSKVQVKAEGAKVNVKAKGAKVKVKVACAKPAGKPAKLLLPFPGKPKKPCQPLIHNKFRVYTDLNVKAWRVQRIGDRKDKQCSFNKDPNAAWAKVCQLLGGRA